jgi:hypothetical protein
MTQEEFLVWIAGCLETAAIPFMVTGSLSSSHYGQPRTTNDVDLVIDPTAEQLARFLDLLGDRFYVSRESAQEALSRRSMFNVIDFDEGWKADLIIRKDRPFSVEELRRRQPRTLRGQTLPIATAEDVILMKLEWNTLTPSERQLQDALSVAVVQWPTLDQPYLRQWASALGVAEQLEELLKQAQALQPRSRAENRVEEE